MMGRLARMLQQLTAPSAVPAWRPQGSDPLIAIPMIDALAGEDDSAARRDGSSMDLGERQRELAFDMYAEALMRITDEEDAAHHRKRRESA